MTDPSAIYLTPAGYWKFANKAVTLFCRGPLAQPEMGFLANIGGHEIYMVYDDHQPTAATPTEEDALIDRILAKEPASA